MNESYESVPSDLVHDVVYFDGSSTIKKFEPPREFLRSCPKIVRSKFAARIIAVAKAPPKRFSGGGYWEAMHGDMSGWFELRVTGPKRDQYRFFCLIDTAAI